MILGNIHQPQTYSYLSPILKQAISYLKQTDMYNLPVGRYELEKELLYVNVMEFDTNFSEQKQAEVHREYIDIQFLISGQERIFLGLENTTNPVFKEYDEINDYYLVSSISCESELLLSPGMFAIFFPEQPHKPRCCIETPMSLKKAVMKMHKSLLV
ncbi:N-acetylneuraminate anomerase [Aeromonas jandaei]|uniref:N-acetylneuraminate anomerase n=1 Tax=Aeromonas jandaei TaxID=650 RepID=UPI0011163935|nr:N-acetylneuraminate anomerase [Aeromonas jandaei]TNH96988.1 YhcH/YjgK/YiaL family protein [Aeromonas jandaei]